ncbi:MAG: 3',5'-cyclic-AMP phosphodiesterase [Pseudohongiellaceae bacterium]
MNVQPIQDPIRIVQVTDTHLYGVPDGKLLKMNTLESLERVLEMIRENESRIDLVLATGDIAQDATEAAYRLFHTTISTLKAPFRWIPGNHDQPLVMAQVAEGSDACNKQEVINNWQIILLDSSKVNHVHGYLAAAELTFLEDALTAASEDNAIEHCLVCLHHNPFPGSAGWMKDIGLHNDREFLDLMERYALVRAVVYGHIHQALDFVRNDIRFMCTPSTCIQFKPEVADFALDNVNPGYRRLYLYRDGQIDSDVHRIEGMILEADYSSAGY